MFSENKQLIDNQKDYGCEILENKITQISTVVFVLYGCKDSETTKILLNQINSKRPLVYIFNQAANLCNAYTIEDDFYIEIILHQNATNYDKICDMLKSYNWKIQCMMAYSEIYHIDILEE